MNNQTIQLAKSIAVRISATAVTRISLLEKDILLEDIRKLYRLVDAELVGTDADAFMAEQTAVNEVNTQRETASIRDFQPPLQDAATPPQAEKSEVLSKISLSEPPASSIEAVSEGPIIFKEELELKKEASVIEESARFSALVGIAGEVDETAAPSSLNEVFMREDSSINGSVSTNLVRDLNSVAASSSFSGLLDLNKRILFTKELFNDNSEAFNVFLHQMERCRNMDEAKSLVNTTALSKSWKIEQDAVKQLVGLVRQHFQPRK